MSVASRSGVAAFAVYDKGNYHIYTLAPDGAARSSAALARVAQTIGVRAAPAAAMLPPLDRRPSDVAALLANDSFGLPAPQTYEVADYKPRLGIEGVGQPTIAVGADRFGAAIGGGLALYFSDMLGDQNLIVAAQLNSGVSRSFSFKDTAAQVGYFNQAKRWNWGVIAGQVPYLSGGIQSSLATVGGEPALVDETILFRQTDRSAAGVVAYPFNRAQRIEFQGGVSQISFDQIVHTQAFSLRTGELIAEDTNEQSVGEAVTLGTSAAALVLRHVLVRRDEPGAGAAVSVRSGAHVRDHQFHQPAGRLPPVLHAGLVLHACRARHALRTIRIRGRGPAAVPAVYRIPESRARLRRELDRSGRVRGRRDERLPGLRSAAGQPHARRPTSSSASRCSVRSACREGMYGPLPVEVAFFADGGVAWSRGDKPEIFGGDRTGVSSAGVALRVNLFGYRGRRVRVVRPFQRPGKGWIFQFQLAPGF